MRLTASSGQPGWNFAISPDRSRAARSWATPANIIRLTATGFATVCALRSARRARLLGPHTPSMPPQPASTAANTLEEYDDEPDAQHHQARPGDHQDRTLDEPPGAVWGWPPLWLAVLGDRNSALSYGSNGIPTNCLAIIAANIDGWRGNDRGVRYTAEAALASIDRYCGANGSSWK